jgi:uncharacterized protein DUF6702
MGLEPVAIVRMPSRWRAPVFALMATLGLAPAAAAHPIHTTLTVVTPSIDGRTLMISVRAFADDFSASVARFAGLRAPADSSVVADEVTRYVRAQFSVSTATGAPLVLEPCGVTRSRELYWLCFRVALPLGLRGTTVRNQMLTELHPDQVNIVQLEKGVERKSYLFTKGSAASVLPG